MVAVPPDSNQADDEQFLAYGHELAAARRDIVPRLTELLARDVDDQTTNPLSILRDAVVHPTDALRALGVSPRPRDRFAVERFPDDDYDLSPASFADIDP